MTATKQAKSAAEREVMQRLSQTSAAWLLGYKQTRNLRDLTDVPVNDDGTYNGQDLLKWARGSRADEIVIVDQLMTMSHQNLERLSALSHLARQSEGLFQAAFEEISDR